MTTYSDTIAGAQRRKAEGLAAMEAEEAERLKKIAVGYAKAEEMLTSLVLPELEQARSDLEDANIKSDVGNGKSNGHIRYSLTIHGQGGSSLLFNAGIHLTEGGLVEPVIECGLKSKRVEPTKQAIEAEIRAFLDRVV